MTTIPALPGSALHGGQQEVEQVEGVVLMLLGEKARWSFADLLEALTSRVTVPSDVVAVAISQMLSADQLTLVDDPKVKGDVAVTRS